MKAIKTEKNTKSRNEKGERKKTNKRPKQLKKRGKVSKHNDGQNEPYRSERMSVSKN
jgi:hypothetical protein